MLCAARAAWQDGRMNNGFGISSPATHHGTPRHAPVRFLIVITSGGFSVARLFLATREQVNELDAATEEVTQMTQGLVPARSASDAAWDHALAGHSADERAAAEVYTLDV
jgi:hypothetical protein